MADIDLERRRGGGMGWVWALLGLAVLVLIVWWAWPDRNDTDYAEEPTEQVEPAAAPEPMVETPSLEQPTLTLDQALANPDRYIGTTFPTSIVEATEVPTDRGFWIEDDGQRLFVVTIPRGNQPPATIEEGAQLRIENGTFRSPSDLDQLGGQPVDEETRGIAGEQRILLVVDPADIEVLNPAPGEFEADSTRGPGARSL